MLNVIINLINFLFLILGRNGCYFKYKKKHTHTQREEKKTRRKI